MPSARRPSSGCRPNGSSSSGCGWNSELAPFSGFSQVLLGPSSGQPSYPRSMDKRLAAFMEESPRLALSVVVGALVLVLGVIDIAPGWVALVVASVMALGWCRWLDESSALASK